MKPQQKLSRIWAKTEPKLSDNWAKSWWSLNFKIILQFELNLTFFCRVYVVFDSVLPSYFYWVFIEQFNGWIWFSCAKKSHSVVALFVLFFGWRLYFRVLKCVRWRAGILCAALSRSSQVDLHRSGWIWVEQERDFATSGHVEIDRYVFFFNWNGFGETWRLLKISVVAAIWNLS